MAVWIMDKTIKWFKIKVINEWFQHTGANYLRNIEKEIAHRGGKKEITLYYNSASC